jgi:hypothetical protein
MMGGLVQDVGHALADLARAGLRVELEGEGDVFRRRSGSRRGPPPEEGGAVMALPYKRKKSWVRR